MKTHLLMMRKAVLIGLIFLLFYATGAIGATYYVATTGSNSNPGTKALPWRTIQKAASTVSAGDTVIVKDGTYADSNTLNSIVIMRTSGTSNNWITFRSENKHGAILDGQNSRAACFYLYGSNYIRLEGFEIKNANLGITLTHHNNSTHDVYVYQCKIHGMGRNILDTRCTINRAYAGITGKPTNYNITVDSCMIYDVGRRHNATYCAHDYKHDHGIYAIGRNWLIKNNLIYNMHSGWAIKLSGHTGSMVGPTHIITNNTFAHDSNDGLYANAHVIYYGDHGTDPHDVIFQNNIFYNPPDTAAIRTNVNLNGTIIRNNITSADNIYVKYSGSGTPTLSNNTTGFLLASFGMTDPENNDFTLKASSSYLINRGIATFAPDKDYTGIGRPKDGNYDIGAYEYIPPEGDLVQSPQNLMLIKP